MPTPTPLETLSGLMLQLRSRRKKFKFRQFQREDLARAALKDGAILSWETGLGKTVAAFAWPMLKGARRVLLVAPEGLHKQMRDSASEFFNTTVLPLTSIEDFHAWKLDRPAVDVGRPKYWITSYQQLGHNGADEWEPKMNHEGIVLNQRDLRLRRERWLRAERIEPSEEHHEGIGETSAAGITCVWKPSMARVIAHHDAFDCVVVDEGTKLQANESHIAMGVRLLQPTTRLVLTATPVKNRLESFFWLAWWAAGGASEPTALWPYEGCSAGREEFANHHLQMDKFVSRENEYQSENGKRRTFEKRSPRVCNIHRLWKLIAPLVVRRTKTNCGEDIVPRVLKPVRVPPGMKQWEIYLHLLENPPKNSRVGKEMDARAQVAVQIGFLREAALCPWALDTARSLVPGIPGGRAQFNPKLWTVLEIIAECLERGEQVVIGSPFKAFSKRLQMLIAETGVSALLLDGDTQPARRAILAGEFKRGDHRVLIGGIQAMGEGYSFECCPNLILPALDWAFDLNKQFQDRVWRLTSPKPVNIYLPVVGGTTDERLAQLFADKSDSAGLVLDGELPEDCIEELDLFALLRDARRVAVKGTDAVDEDQLAARWPELRARLARAVGRRAVA